MRNKILLIVTGSISFYKSYEILRSLRKANKRIRVILTKGALQFASPLSFMALSAEEVFTSEDSFSLDDAGVSLHLSLSRWADIILVAPASADFIAKCAVGIADELALTTLLAFDRYKDVLIVPAMNNKMYENPITDRNINKLKNIGVHFVGPVEGDLADLSKGKGRLADQNYIIKNTLYLLETYKPFAGKKILVTAGPTREYLDPVRFISNGSSGKMGFAIAEMAKMFGAEVYLIAGHTTAELPVVDHIVFADTTEDLLSKISEIFPTVDALIMAAAPVDFKPDRMSLNKIKKQPQISLTFKSAPDILKTISKFKKNQITVGFALETENVLDNAQKKMLAKQLDIIIANRATNMGTDIGSVIIIDKYGKNVIIENKDKEEIAREILLFLKEYMDKEV